MKKHYFRSAVAALLPLLLIAQPVEACTGFIIGKKLTADGSTLVGRTEDLEPNHNKNFVVRERVYNKKGAIFEDAANGFQYPLPEISYKYTAVPEMCIRDRGYTGTFIMYNRKKQEAVIFLSNRTYEKDERAQWILDRNSLMDLIKQECEK